MPDDEERVAQSDPPGPSVPGEITQQLLRARFGDPVEMDALFDLVYHHLKRMARQRLRGTSTPTLDVTSLVHEAYLRLADAPELGWKDRQHFFAVAARAMRQIVVDRARRRRAVKRGGEWVAVEMNDRLAAPSLPLDQILAVDEALVRLGDASPRMVLVVELCFFAGLTTEEAAATLGVTARTVKREWQKARLLLGAWLRESGA
jgi:RNA polymerase sigma factor (TIGR02999 family)